MSSFYVSGLFRRPDHVFVFVIDGVFVIQISVKSYPLEAGPISMVGITHSVASQASPLSRFPYDIFTPVCGTL